MIKKAVALFFAFLFSFSLFSCTNTPAPYHESAVIISKQSVCFAGIGDLYELDFYVIKDGRKAPELSDSIVWTTSNPGVAICENGVITSTGYGSCVVRASFEDKYAVCVVQTPRPHASLSISESHITLDNIGSSQYIYAFSDDGEEISSSVEWISSNKNVAVCKEGVVSAVGYGSCTIMVHHKTETAVCTVTVNNPTAPTVTLSEASLKLGVGEEHTLVATAGYNAGKIVSWKSTDESIATCTDGKVTGLSDGMCVILALSENGYSGYSIVTVGNPKKSDAHKPYLNFEFRNLGRELKYVNKTTGEAESSLLVYDYEMETQLLSDGRLVVEISLICIKTYDVRGAEETASSALTASIYREQDAFCDKKQYRTTPISVGEPYKIKCSGFTVQTTTDGTLRELYMTLSPITEHQQISR